MLTPEVERLIFDDKVERLEDEDLSSHFANNFATLEPNDYDLDDAEEELEFIQSLASWFLI